MIRVWSDARPSGLLDRDGRGCSFAYAGDAQDERAVSVTMPRRIKSYDQPFGLLPIFEMNLPEAVLRERLRLAFAKATGGFDDFDLLTIVGRSQVGRLRYTGADDDLDDSVPFQSVDEILDRRRDGGLFRYLLDRFAQYSGISGVQPKILVRDEGDAGVLAAAAGERLPAIRGATHIVKFWEPKSFPELAANEYFCLKAAARCGLAVPRARLADDGAAIVIDRFDVRPDGSYRGVEDFCVLNARATADKYRGGYETAVFKRLKDFMIADPAAWREDAERLFILFVLNCAIRNGDAHLKNFAIVYDRVDDVPRLAPVYDLVTTTVYLPADSMALTLGGATRWPSARKLAALGTLRCGLPPKRVRFLIERIADALSDTTVEIRTYAADRPEFAQIAERMVAAWEEGRASILG